MSRRGVVPLWTVVAAGLLAASPTTPQAQEAAPPPVQAMIGEEAPDFELPTLDGEKVSLQGLRGKLVVLHFGASW